MFTSKVKAKFAFFSFNAKPDSVYANTLRK